MALSIEEVEHIAELARLGLSSKEKEALKEELASILNWVSKLQEVNTSKVEPIAQITGLVNAWREDEVKPFPERLFDGGLKVKKVLDK
ncbi:MAG: Asp-tRNA(Asn)/Glu-tRNA(Gln) amidotransferase subunit GatC [bacterium]